MIWGRENKGVWKPLFDVAVLFFNSVGHRRKISFLSTSTKFTICVRKHIHYGK